MNGAGSRAKGSKLEREVVNAAKAAGLTAERTAPMQGVGRVGGADVTINGWILVECKSHKRISGWVQIITSILLDQPCPLTKEQQAWVGSQHALVLKQTGWPEPIVIQALEEGYYGAMTMTAWLKSIKDKGAGDNGEADPGNT